MHDKNTEPEVGGQLFSPEQYSPEQLHEAYRYFSVRLAIALTLEEAPFDVEYQPVRKKSLLNLLGIRSYSSEAEPQPIGLWQVSTDEIEKTVTNKRRLPNGTVETVEGRYIRCYSVYIDCLGNRYRDFGEQGIMPDFDGWKCEIGAFNKTRNDFEKVLDRLKSQNPAEGDTINSND